MTSTLPRLDALVRDRAEAGESFFPPEAERIARLCHRMAERFARGGRLGTAVLEPEREHDVARLGDQLELGRQRAALAGQRDGRERALADDHRVDELDRDVADVRAGRGRAPDRDQPPAAGEPLGHRMAQRGQVGGDVVEEPPVGVGARSQQVLDRGDRLGPRHRP